MTPVRPRLDELPQYGDQGPAWVYRHLDASEGTLYIGVTSSPEQRQVAHARSAKWWDRVKTVVYHGPLRANEAAELERSLIAAELPPFNVQGTPRMQGQRRSTSHRPASRTEPLSYVGKPAVAHPRIGAGGDDILRPADVERDYSVSESTLATWRANKTGPAWFRLGPRRIVYRRSVVAAWVAQQERQAVA